MFKKSIQDLDYQDIEELVKIQKQLEGTHLDYKENLYGNNIDRAKAELSKDISAFANSQGGFLIFGVSDDCEIKGIDSIIGKNGVIEWINQVLRSGIEPNIIYPSPKIIEIPHITDKIILVFEVPESTSKPHMAIEKHSYFVRYHDISIFATHHQIKEMFKDSLDKSVEINEVEEFLKKRNLFDEESLDFGINELSKLIVNPKITNVVNQLPLITISVIPKKMENININLNELKGWLDNSQNGYYVYLDSRHEFDVKRNGFVIRKKDGINNTFCLQVTDNGCIEATLSKHFFSENSIKEKNNKEVLLFDATSLNEYLLALMNFVPSFFDFCNYSDEMTLQISFIDVKNITLYFFNENHRYPWYFQDEFGVNKYEKNFKIVRKLLIGNLNMIDNIEIVKGLSDEFHRVFSHEKDLCFVDNKLNRFPHFRW
jgi:hypothetical protein